MYRVVLFTDENEVAVIPNNWLEGVSCAVWPPYRTDSLNMKAAKSREKPKSSWKAYPIRELFASDDFEVAWTKSKVAQMTSELESEAEPEVDGVNRPSRRTKHAPMRFHDTDSEEERENVEPIKKMRVSNSKIPPAQIHSQPSISSISLPSPPPRPVTMSRSPLSLISHQAQEMSPPTPPPAQFSQPSSSSVSLRTPPPPPRPVTTSRSPLMSCQAQVMSPPTSSARVLSWLSSTSLHTPPPPRPVTMSRSQVMSRPAPVMSPPSPATSTTHSAARPHHASDVERDRRLFLMLEKIMEEVKCLHKKMDALSLRAVNAEEEEDEWPEDISLPFNTVQEVDSFEEQLQDKDLQKVFVRKMILAGGTSLEATVYNMMTVFWGNHICSEFNWTGKKSAEKPMRSFVDLKNIKTLLFRSVRKNTPTRNATDSEIKEVVRKFIKNGRDRGEGRETRRRRQGAVLPDNDEN